MDLENKGYTIKGENMNKATLVRTAEGIGSTLAAESTQAWNRRDETERLLWITPFMRNELYFIKVVFVIRKDLKKILKK